MFDVSPPKPRRYARRRVGARLVELDHRLAEGDDVERARLRSWPRRQRTRPRRANAAAAARTSRRGARPVQVRPGAEARGARRPSTAPCCRAGCRRRRTPASPSAARRATPSAPPAAAPRPGNILRPSAPAASAANASVGVATPGTQTSPAAFASRTTATSACGITISRPPASRTRATSSTSMTVPAPTRQSSPMPLREQRDRRRTRAAN